jgi:hypothetical protein
MVWRPDPRRRGLAAALAEFELETAERAMQTAFTTGSLQYALEDVLLPALDALGEQHGTDSATWVVGARWADGWLRRTMPVVGPSEGVLAILLADATGPELGADGLARCALELCCALGQGRVTTLPVSRIGGLPQLADALAPDVVVIAGDHAGDGDVARWVDAACAAGPLPIAVFRRPGLPDTLARVLPPHPVAAQRALMALAAGR